jgi:pyrroline-5-carboxylate reductase
MKIAFIGGGNMGEAMISAILSKEISSPRDITVGDISENRRQYLKKEYDVIVIDTIRQAAESGEVIVLAIKPQNASDVMTELNGLIRPGTLVLSIMAGVKIETIRRGLNHNLIVRVMPNTPAQIGEGMSVWTATEEVTGQQREWASSILGAMGKEVYVQDEDSIDKATAVMGSGPAYFFLFVESLVDAAINIGMSREMATELVLQTMLGSGLYIQKSGKPPAELRKMVTSPGGTTAEALNVFEKEEFPRIITQAVTAAYEKAKKLGENT